MVSNNTLDVRKFLTYVLKKETGIKTERIKVIANKFSSLSDIKKTDMMKETFFSKYDLQKKTREKFEKIRKSIQESDDVRTNYVWYLYGRFVERAVNSIQELSMEKMVEKSSINPFMAKALGLDDIDSISKYFVVQTLSRSLVTSFGTTLEELIKVIAGGDKGDWWDVVKGNHHWSVKSGPNDMNKDQTVEFASRAKRLLSLNNKALPKILMGYGKEPHQVITGTLEKEGLDPQKHTVPG